MDARNDISGNKPSVRTVNAEDVRAALGRVLNSATFARADRARSLLTYLVETELNGDAARLKGFAIAQDVFGKDDGFDPATDSVVRVQAGRLREHLTAFYASEGKDDPVEIGVPKGSYVPTYARRDAQGEASHDTATHERANTSDGDEEAGMPRIVDFGHGTIDFKLDGDVPDEPLAATRRLSASDQPEAQDALLSPFIVRNVKRFWLALAIIVLLLTVILVLVWRP